MTSHEKSSPAEPEIRMNAQCAVTSDTVKRSKGVTAAMQCWNEHLLSCRRAATRHVKGVGR